MQAEQLNIGEVTIALFCGGGCQAAATNLDIVGADIGLFFDVPMELGDGVMLDSRVIPVPLAQGESVGSLLAKFSQDPRFKEACQVLRSKPGDLTQGLAQTPVLGAMAYEDLQGLDNIYQQILNKVRALTNGAPERIRVVTLGSNSGGTGRGTLLKATKALVKVLHDSTDAVINVQNVRIGAQTFNGLGVHIRGNNAIGMVEDLAYVLGSDYGIREVRNYLACELPMVGEDKTLRDKYVRLFLQALCSPQTQETLGRRDVNMALTGAFGRLNVVQAGFWMLPDQVNLVAIAAVNLLPQVRSLMDEKPAEAEKPEVQVAVDLKVIKTADHEGLLSLIGGYLPPEDVRRYIEAEYEASAAVFIQTGKTELPLDSVLLTGLPKSIRDYSDRRDQLEALRQAVQSVLDAIRRQEAITQMQLIQVQNALGKIIGQLFPKNVVQRVQAVMGNKAKNLVALKAGLKKYADLERKLEEVRVKHQALEEALQAVERAVEQQRDYLQGVYQWLLKESQNEGVVTDLFTFRSLEDVFGEMLVGRFSNDRQQFNAVVSNAISGVNREGLVKLMVQDDSQTLNLARAMMATSPTVTPPWGGKRRRSKPRSFIVIPPVAQELFTQLEQALQDLGSSAQLLQTETVSGGLAVVALDSYFVDNINDVQTTQYGADLRKAHDSGLDLLARIPGNPGEEELTKILEQIAKPGGEQ